MVSFGCVAKLLSSLECRSNVWIKTVNPNWYAAREIPKVILTEKVLQAAQATTSKIRAMRDRPNTAEPPKKLGTPMSQPYF
ncbi:uncharacterized protein [Drosophila kikkawai]|uniref:Uncharacterized protein n=1 Tax=Drosophila kikkawai TaxID=30033 RepID=A0A6P4IXQ1_DROKI|nr:uncharacterized protein LOC108082473 [Drosophila kikkawai]KAH8336832.1 hypothetical protein KR059_005013 [Drosophila kikkawai]